MVELIVAVDKNFGIGKDNKLPWNIPEELKIFKEKTKNNVVIFGRKTFSKLPKLRNRICYSFTRSKSDITIEQIYKLHDDNKTIIFIGGGSEIYKLAFETGLVKKIHISFIKDEYDCDTFFDKTWLKNFVITEETKFENFTHCVMEYTEKGERQYLNLLEDVLNNGVEKIGRNGTTISKFGNTMKFDLRQGFPLLTTKKMFTRGIIEELLFFIRGETDTKLLEEKKINIWKGNTDKKFLDSIGKSSRKEGLMGPMYGYIWRNAGAVYDETTGKPLKKGIDQLEEVINLIKTDPNSRRILMTTYNVEQVKEGCLYPCHSLILQFYTEGEYLDMYCYNRSSDLFLGLPFNITSSSLLLTLIAKVTNYIPRFFTLGLGDCHIYETHKDVVKTQIDRIPYNFPQLSISKKIENIEDIENLEYIDFNFIDYKSKSRIKADMIA